MADIGGLEVIVDELCDSVIAPLCFPEVYSSYSSLLTSPSGVLLYGPPGCGKTLLAKAIAKESNSKFFNIQLSSILDLYVL